ncbi:2-oxo-4-hydroxy-4-carboxy-5-ureidoimidazoline decarboxylase [Streptomyces sp. NPDC058417]|uniref:2-oxo-4-hydroxy-4-carboxy-5-ureidoimidazoline decarboxylase n=1 Tax=unclassified Streptomyces TaxID=2593676 RepID=UPI003646C583
MVVPVVLAARTALPEQPRTPRTPSADTSPLDRFNGMPAEAAHAALLDCLHSPRWARRIAEHRPYPTPDALLAAAEEAAYDLSPADLAEALAAESLPALPQDAYSAAHTALRAAHAAYEARFGHAFVIYLGATPPAEVPDRILERIGSRLANDPDSEREEAAEELRRLARGRLSRLLRDASNYATRHNDPAAGA